MKTGLLLLCGVCIAGSSWSQQATDPNPGGANGGATASTPASAAPAQWLFGNWVFDEEYTRTKHAEVKKEPGLVEGLSAAVASQLAAQLKGAKLTISETELIMTRADGNGKSERHTIVAGTDPNVAQLKEANGEITAFHRDGDRIWMNSTGSVNEPFYFRRTE
jgi:hypothetical protein